MTAPITTSRITLAEYARNIFVVTPEHGTPFEDILKPSYWLHVADTVSMRLRPYDRIEVRPEDGSYFAELIVRSVNTVDTLNRVTGEHITRRGEAVLYPLCFVQIEKATPLVAPASVVTDTGVTAVTPAVPEAAKAPEPIPAADIGTAYEVVFKGPHRKWSVMRNDDKAIIKENMGTREEADLWLTGYHKALAA